MNAKNLNTKLTLQALYLGQDIDVSFYCRYFLVHLSMHTRFNYTQLASVFYEMRLFLVKFVSKNNKSSSKSAFLADFYMELNGKIESQRIRCVASLLLFAHIRGCTEIGACAFSYINLYDEQCNIEYNKSTTFDKLHVQRKPIISSLGITTSFF